MRGRQFKNITVATLGNALEFYDFTVFSTFAIFIGRAFFPTRTPFISLMFSLALFGIGFVTRPLGGIVIGAYADRAGRKPAMTLTIWLMTLGSAVIALLPTYRQIGPAAPIILVLARLIQGFAAGGELGPATAYLMESAPEHRKAFVGSWQLASQSLGSVFAGFIGFTMAQRLSEEALSAWAWRVPFLFGLLIAPVGLYIRKRLDETLDTGAAHKSGQAVLSALCHQHRRELLLCLLLVPGATITAYFMRYATIFAISALQMSTRVAFLVNLAIGISGTTFAIVGGVLGDRFGLRAVALWPRVLLAVLIYPIIHLMVEHKTPVTVISGFVLLEALQAMSGSVCLILMLKCFPPTVRTAGLSIAYAIGVSIFGGSAQFIFTWLMKATGNPVSLVFWVIVTNLLTIYAVPSLARTKH